MLPWEFSPVVLATVVLALVLYSRGLARMSAPISHSPATAFYCRVFLILGLRAGNLVVHGEEEARSWPRMRPCIED
jgi:hypothetical protein